MSNKYFRHIMFGHVVQLTGVGATSDVFRGIVVEQGNAAFMAVGTYSDVWGRDHFEPCEWQSVELARPVDTFESMQAELDDIRLALGIDAEPLDTLPARMIARANGLRKLYEKVKDAVDAHR